MGWMIRILPTFWFWTNRKGDWALSFGWILWEFWLTNNDFLCEEETEETTDLTEEEKAHTYACVKNCLEASIYGQDVTFTDEEVSNALGLGEDGIMNIMMKLKQPN